LTELSDDPQCLLPRSQIYRLFTSIDDLRDQAGLSAYEAGDQVRARRMLNRLTWLAEHLGRAPWPADYREHYDGGYQYYLREWGSFEQALQAAGIKIERDFTAPDQAERALRECASALRRTPTMAEYRLWAMEVDEDTGEESFGSERPSPSVLRAMYGTWTGALQAAGLVQRVTREQGIQSVRACAASYGHSPTATQYREWVGQHEGAPSMAELLALFGRWNGALEAAELPVRIASWTKADVRAWVDAWRAEQSISRPTQAEWDEWVQAEPLQGPRAATVARLLGAGSWRMVWR
jgi:hypothetical protein